MIQSELGEVTTDVSANQRFRGTNQSGMRAHNEKLILTLLRRQPGLAKSDLTRQTGLSAQTISVIMRTLEKEGLVQRGEPQRGRIGQPSIPLSLNPNGAYAMGLKIGRRSTDLVLTNFLGEVIYRTARTHRYPNPRATVDFAFEAIDDLVGRLAKSERSRIAGLGIAMPFYLWSWAQALGVPDATMAVWKSADIRGEIASRYNFPVYLENDASSACAAEVAYGRANGLENYLYFYVGYFIGGGIVLNGNVFAGPDGNAGALGPMPVPVNGRTGQLIEVASLSELERQLAVAGFQTGSMWEGAENWYIDDAILERWISAAAAGLAYAIASACSIVDFPAIVVDGWLPIEVRARLVETVRLELEKTNMTGLERPVIHPGDVGADARVLGAASLPISARFLLSHVFMPQNAA
jgi:predicted NBD/HSP70 family sugar kinase